MKKVVTLMRRANSYVQLLIGHNRAVPLMMKIGVDINVISKVLGSKRYLQFLETLVRFLENDKLKEINRVPKKEAL
jgi:hypothetical protein